MIKHRWIGRVLGSTLCAACSGEIRVTDATATSPGASAPTSATAADPGPGDEPTAGGSSTGSGSTGDGDATTVGSTGATTGSTAPGDTTEAISTADPATTGTGGDRVCVPNTGECDGTVAKKCNEDGSAVVETFCDEVQGVTCNPGVGECVGACSPAALGTSYIGCDYYAVVTPTWVSSTFTFAIVVSNTTTEDADLTITQGDQTLLELVVPKGSVEVIPLPWQGDLKSAWPSALVPDGAYRVRSTRPVTVYQYSPLEYEKDGEFSYVNDASLLMPTNVWGTETVAIARNTQSKLPGWIAVVAREDGTTVEVQPSATGKVVLAGGGIAADGTGAVMLGEGDVLLVLSGTGGGQPETADKADLTGTRVVSDRPVQVLGGHECTYVPFNVIACDHLEELNLPLANLSREVLVTMPWIKPPGEAPQPKPRMVRIVATADDTTLTYDPPQDGAPTALAKAGDYVEIKTAADLRIKADRKIAVAEYMLGVEAGGGTGDPSMTIAVPLEQYRSNYSFHAPTNYESNFVNVTAPTGAKITLDGQPVAGFVPIGGSGYGVARVELSNAGDGDHTVSGDQPFGIQVYGYGQNTSYWYPGGLDLEIIPQ